MQNRLNVYQDKYLSKFKKKNEDETNQKLNQLQLQIDNINKNFNDYTQMQENNSNVSNYTNDDNVEFLPKVGYSLLALPLKLGQGLTKGIEGIVDAGATIAGSVGGLFGADTDWSKEFVQKDLTNDLFSTSEGNNWVEDVYHNSWWDDNKVLNYVGQATEAIGGMLPSIGMHALLPGTGLIELAVQAGGNAAEEAYNINPDITVNQALAYGTLSGLTEAATEKMFDAFKFLGGGVADKLVNKITKNQLTRIGIGMLGEGIEEVVSDLVNPISQRITGVNAEAEAPTLAELIDSFIVGTMTSVIMGGANVVKQGGINNYLMNENIQATLNNNQEILNQYNKVLKDSMTAEEYNSLKNDSIEYNEKLNNVLESYKNGTLETDSKNKKQFSELLKQRDNLIDKTNEAVDRYKATHSAEKVDKFMQKTTAFQDSQGEKITREKSLELAKEPISKPLTLEQKQKIIEKNNMEYKYDSKTGEYNKKYAKLNTETKASLDKIVNNVKNLTNDQVKVNVEYDGRKIKTNTNAYYDSSSRTITINAKNVAKADADSIVKNISSHELYHYLKNSKSTTKLHNQVIEELKKENKYNSELENKREIYPGESTQYLEEEMVADWLAQNTFTSQASVNELVENDRTLAQKILDWTKLQSASDSTKTIKKVEKMFYKALQETTNNQKNVDNQTIKKYNKEAKGEMNYGDEFRRIQEESRREFNTSSWFERSERNNETLRRRLSDNFKRELDSRGYNSSTSNAIILKSNKNTEFKILRDVDKQLFHDIFEISRTYLKNGELVDLHENYEDCTCYLSDDGLSGFGITENGDLVSVYNLNKSKKGFLSAISSIVKEKAKTLDCYMSPNQNLQEMYSKAFGFKTASIMDYNMEFDHDNIAKNHNMPQVAFMINATENVETKHFNKDQYDEAVKYRDSYLKKDNIRYSKNKYQTTNEIKLQAELKQKKVYSYKEVDTMVNDFINTFTSSKNKYFKNSKESVVKQFFTELNTGNVNANKLANDLSNSIINNLVINNKGLDASYKALMLDELVPQFQSLIKNGGKTATVESLKNNYQRIINEQASRIVYYKNVSQESNKVFKKIEKLKKMTSKDYKYNPEAQHIADTFNNLTKLLKSVNKSTDVGRKEVRNIISEYGKSIEKNKIVSQYVPQEVINDIDFITNNLNDANLNKHRLTLEELNAVKNIAANAIKMINEFDTATINNQKVHIHEYSQEAIKQVKSNPKQFGAAKINKFLRSFEKPAELIKDLEFSVGGKKGNITKLIVDPLQQSDLQYKRNVLDLHKTIDEFNSEHKGYSKKRLVKSTIQVGKNNLTVGQAIYLTMLAKRPQAANHFLIDVNQNAKGIQLYDKPGKSGNKTALIKLTTNDIVEIESKLTDTDKAYRKMAEEIFNEKAKELKIETDNRYLGYTNTIEPYYVPIHTDDATKWKGYGDARQTKSVDSLFGLYFNQNVVEGASNSITLNNINDVLDNHIDLVSKYNAYIETVKNIQRVLNQQISVDGTVTTLRNEISYKWKDFDDYLQNILMAQINVNTSVDDVTGFMAKLRSNFAKSVLGVNVKSWVNQFSGIPTAASIIDYSSLAKGVTMKNTKATRAEMDQYTQGYTEFRNYDREVFKNEANITHSINWAGDVLTKPMSSVDRVSIGILWNSCQVEVAKKYNLEIGTKENKVKAGELLNDVMRRTQEASTAIDKPAISRTNSEVMKSLMMFTNQSMQSLSLFTSSIREHTRVKRLIKIEGKTDINSKYLKSANKKIAKATSSIIVSNIIASIIGVSFTKFLGKDDEEETLNQQLLSEFTENTVGLIPIARNLYGMLVNGYDLNDNALSLINNVISSSTNLFEKATEGKATLKDWNKFFYTLSATLGIPTKNIENYVYGIINTFDPALALKYKTTLFGTTTAQQYAVLEEAIQNNDMDLATGTLDVIMAANKAVSIDSDKVNETIAQLIAKGYTSVLPKSISNNLITFNSEQYELKGNNLTTFTKYYNNVNSDLNKLVNMSTFKNLSEEEQAKVIKYLFNYYYYLALNKTFNADVSNVKIVSLVQNNKYTPINSALYLVKK